MQRSKRDWLNEYTRAHRDIELAELAIHACECMSAGRRASSAVRLLKAEQQRALRDMDRAAAALGAPYPSPPR